MVGASSALAALIKSVLNKTYLLHYGAEFLPFLEVVSGLKDKDSSWALKVEEEDDDSSVNLSDEERSLNIDSETPESKSNSKPLENVSEVPPSVPSVPRRTRERKASLPLTAKVLIFPQSATSPPGSQQGNASFMHSQITGLPQKQIIRTLIATSQQLNLIDPTDIAHELTSLQCSYFLKIEVRHL